MSRHDSDHQPAAAGDRRASIQLWFLGIIVALGLTWFLRSTASFTLPLACALLIALAAWPVCSRIRDAVPDKLRWLGTTAAMLIVVGLLSLFLLGMTLIGRQALKLAQDIRPELHQKLDGTFAGSIVGTGDQASKGLDFLAAHAMTALSTAWTVVAGVLLVLFLVLLMLSESRTWSAKIGTVSEGGRDWAAMGRTVGQRFRTFFLTRLLLGSITAVLYVAYLALFGIDYLLIWGLLAVLLNFIPTIGSLIAGALPVIYAFVSKDPATAAAVAGGLLVIEQLMGNFVDPKLMGRQLSISPLVVLISLLFWAWIWGIAGAFLAVPLTVLVVIVFAHIDPLKPIALMLSNERSMEDLEEHSGGG